MRRILVRKKEHITDFMFVLLLLLLFVSFGLCVVIVGTKVYQSTISHMEENYSSGTALAYTIQKVRQNNEVGSVELTKLGGEYDSLMLHSNVNGESYVTYIYAYNGYLWELYTKQSTEVSLGMGQKLVEIKEFLIEKIDTGLYRIKAISQSDEELCVSIHVLEEEE